MDLIKLNSIIEGKYTETAKRPSRTAATIEDLIEFRKLMQVNELYQTGLNRTESAEEYFEAYDLMREATLPELREEMFYAAKLGYMYEGIPSKLVYLLQAAIRKYETPNAAIKSIDGRLLLKYTKEGLLPEGVTIKRIMENIYGKPIRLLSAYNRVAEYGEWLEVYVPNTDRVLVVSNALRDFFESQDDLESVEYVQGLGVCIRGVPIRALGSMAGITADEYDLRKCR